MLDGNGLFDIRVSLPSDRNKTGTLQLFDRNGNYVMSCVVLGKGSSSTRSDRTTENADTPLGTYDIPNKQSECLKGDQPEKFGPNPRIVLTPQSGEIVETKRTNIRIHGKEKEKKDKNGNTELSPTNGCMRASNEDMKKLNEAINKLFENDSKEYGGKCEVFETSNQNDNGSLTPNKQLPNK